MKNLYKFVLASVLLLMLATNAVWGQTAGDYRSKATGNWNANTTWERYDGSSWLPAVSTPTSADGVITIQNGHTVTISATVTYDQVTVDAGGQVTVASTITHTLANGTGTDLTINGTWLNSGGTWTVTGAAWAVGSGGTFIHNTTSGISTPLGAAALDAASNFIYRGSSTLTPAISMSGRIYGNLSFESTSGTYSVTATGSTNTSINGNFTIGSGVTITNNYTGVLSIAGNFSNNGTLTNNTGIQVYTFTGSGKTIGGSGAIVFETWNINSGASITLNNNVSVPNGFTLTVSGTLDFGSSIVSGQGAFVLSASGATIKTMDADGFHLTGVSGCIQLGSLTYTTGTTYVYYRNGAQNTGTGLPQTSFTGLTVGSTDNATNLTINNATSKAIVGGTLTLISNSTSNSTIASGTVEFGVSSSELKYQGASSQTTTSVEFPSSNGPYSLTIDNANGVTLHSNRTIDGILKLTSGKLSTGANVITLGTSISSLGFLMPLTPTSASYIVGNFERWFAASTVSDVYFPVGTAARYLPAVISYTVAPTTGGKLKVSANTTDPGADNTSNLDDGGYTIDRYSNNAWWQFTATTLAGGTYSLNLQGDGILGASAVNYTKLRLLKRAAGSQTWGLSGTHADATGSNTSPLIKRTGLTGFSEFGIGGYSVDGNNLGDAPLPVTLSSFVSIISNRNVMLSWTTLKEANNAGFEIQRSVISNQLSGYSKIGYVNGQGTKNTPTTYAFEDRNLNTGKYKYRLKQVDVNGNYEYYELNGEVEISVPKKYDLSQNYPNPFNPLTKINFDLPENGLVNIRLYDMLGREVGVIVNEVRNAGYHTVQFDASRLSSGMYFYKMSAGKFSGIKKMAVIK